MTARVDRAPTCPSSLTGDTCPRCGGQGDALFQLHHARARSTDPETSQAAAASVDDLPGRQRAVLTVLTKVGPLTDEELVLVYNRARDKGAPMVRQSPSGLRTRRAELVRLGLVRWTGERKRMRSTASLARLWEVVR